METKQIIKRLVVVGVSSAIAFSIFKKIKKEVKLYKELNSSTTKEYEDRGTAFRDGFEEGMSERDDVSAPWSYSTDNEAYWSEEIALEKEPIDIRIASIIRPQPDNIDEDYHEEEYDPDEIAEEEDEDLIYYAIDETKEEGELQYPINSDQALKQYREMRVAGLSEGEDGTMSMRNVILRLFEYPFIPQNSADEWLFDRLVDIRADFFTPDSKHTENPSMGDLILHYAESLDYNLDRGVNFWVDVILRNTGFTWGMGDVALDMHLENLRNHVFVGRDGYGLFGLYNDTYLKMVNNMAHGEEMSFDREYNAYLEQAMQDEREGLNDE